MPGLSSRNVVSAGILAITVGLFLVAQDTDKSSSVLSQADTQTATLADQFAGHFQIDTVRSTVKQKITDIGDMSVSPIVSYMSPIVSPISPPDIFVTQYPLPTIKETLAPSLNPTISVLIPTQPKVTSVPAIKMSPSPAMSPIVSPSVVPTVINPSPSPSSPMSVKVVINEIGWSGTDASASDEWIELYNPGSEAVSLEGWTLVSITDGSPTMQLKGTLAPDSFYLIERTDDGTIRNVSAQLAGSFGKGGLANDGEYLQLRSQQGEVIDTVDCGGGWYAGTVSPRGSMERIKLDSSGKDSWVTQSGTYGAFDKDANPVHGTPGARNSGS